MKRIFTYTFMVGLLAVLAAVPMQAQQLDYVQGDLIVQLKPGYEPEDLLEVTQRFELLPTGMQLKYVLSKSLNIWLFEMDYVTINEENFLNHVRRLEPVYLAQANRYIEDRAIPNDPQFDNQWQWLNPGGSGSTEDADVDADLAWDITTGGTMADGTDIVVCVVEGGGSNYDHPDLIDNHWVNENEIPDNGIDDDNNGYIDDYNGWNPGQNNDNIFGGNHGTGVSGMIGAKGNNNLGVAGINWDVKIMQVILPGVFEAGVIQAYTYAYDMRKLWNDTNGAEGAFVVATNSSWGIDFGDPASAPLWCDFYNTLGEEGILSCGATANNNVNIDVVGDLPTACPSDFMISVTATNDDDERTFSAYGIENVDFAAPGGGIYTTSGGSGYGNTSGTSFATPLTAGVIALMYSAPCAALPAQALANPEATAALIRDYIFTTLDTVPSLVGDVKYGGRINAHKAVLAVMDNCGPCPSPAAQAETDVTDVNATLNWSVLLDDATTNLRIRALGTMDWDTLVDVTPPLELTDLSVCQGYEYQLLSLCPDTTGEYSQSNIFYTDGCCDEPEGSELLSVTDTEASIAWGDVLAAGSYEVVVQEIGGPATVIETSSTSIVLEDLNPCTGYDITIESLCAADSTSGPTEVLSFFTECPCPVPINFDTLVVTTEVASFQWDAAENAENYLLRYRNLAGGPWEEVVTSSTSFMLEGLEPCSNYRAQVKTICPIDESIFSSNFNFKTACIPSSTNALVKSDELRVVPNPFVEGFELVWTTPNLTDEVNLSVLDVTGKVFLQQLSQAVNGRLEVDGLAQLPAGLYFLHLQQGDQVWIKRIVKE
jgi:serine protease